MTPLQHHIGNLIRTLPPAILHALADSLNHHQHLAWPSFRPAVLSTLTSKEQRLAVAKLLDAWRDEQPDMPVGGVVLALRTACDAWHRASTQEITELTWTGPTAPRTQLRSSGEALIELIARAEKRIQIVSFAVYRYQPVVDALLAAAARGVQIDLYFELLDGVDHTSAYDLVGRLSPQLVSVVSLYYWPDEQRKASPSGRFGSLHAKVAVADRKMLLVSSANLTGHALTINLETGVLIRGGTKPGQIANEIDALLHVGVFRSASGS